MKNKTNHMFALVLCCAISPVYASDKASALAECVELSSEMNKNVPLVVDKLTKLDSTFCTPGRLKPVLNYRASMSAPKAKLNYFDSASPEMKRQQTNSWCSDPAQRKLLKRVDVLNHYYDSDRIYLGQIQVTLGDCANRQ